MDKECGMTNEREASGRKPASGMDSPQPTAPHPSRQPREESDGVHMTYGATTGYVSPDKCWAPVKPRRYGL